LKQAVLREITPELTEDLNQTTFLDVLKKPAQPDNRLYSSSPLDATAIEKLQNFELYYTSGKGHLTFDGNGKRHRQVSAREFNEEEQFAIGRALASVALEMVGKARSISLSDLAQKVRALTKDDAAVGLSKINEILDEATSRLHDSIRLNNKGAELEILFEIEGARKLNALDRREYRDEVARKLNSQGNAFIRKDFKVFSGFEFCKVTLFDKADTVNEIIQGLNEGTVIAFGDSMVDVPFLSLTFGGIDYRGYYLGPNADVASFNNIIKVFGEGAVSEEQKLAAARLIIRNAIASRERGELNLVAIISDIDGCATELNSDMDDEMLALYVKALGLGVKIFLVGGGDIEKQRLDTRIVDKLEQAIASQSSSPLYTGLEHLRFEVNTLRMKRSKVIDIFGQENKTWFERSSSPGADNNRNNFQQEVSRLFNLGLDGLGQACGIHGTSIEAILYLAKYGRLPNTGRVRDGFCYYPLGDQELSYILSQANDWAEDNAVLHYVMSKIGFDLNPDEISDLLIFVISDLADNKFIPYLSRFLKRHSIAKEQLAKWIEEVRAQDRRGVVILLSKAVEEVFPLDELDTGERILSITEGLPIEYIVGINTEGEHEFDTLESLDASSPLYTGLEHLRFEVSTLRIARSKVIDIFGQENKAWQELFEHPEIEMLLLRPNFRELLAGLNVSAGKKEKFLDALKIQTDWPGAIAALNDYQKALRQQEFIFRKRFEDFLSQLREKYSSDKSGASFGSSPLISGKNKAIITDLGGVIVRSDQTLMLQEFSAASGKSPAEIADLLPNSIARALSSVGAITDDAFIVRLQRELGIGGMDRDTFLRLYNSGYSVDREMIALLNILKLLGYKVAILSDIGTIHYAYMLNFLPINQLNLSWLDGFFASCDLEMTKPNLPVYEHVLHNLGIAANDAIFIDDREVNVAAAESLGITGIHFTGAEKLKRELINLGVLDETFLEETSEGVTENVAISIRSIKHSSASDVFNPLSGLNMYIQIASEAENAPQELTEIGLKVKEISDALHALHNAAKAVTCGRIVSRGEVNLLHAIFAVSIEAVSETLSRLRMAVATQKDIDSAANEVSAIFRHLNTAYQYMRELPQVLRNRFARFNAEPKLRRVNVDELLALIDHAYRHWRSDNHWQVHVVGKPHKVLVMVDVVALENSISNAIKNSLEAGAQKIEIFVGYEGPNVFITISDDGHGIENKNLAATPSGRPLVCALNASTKDNSGEMRGLGLSEAYNAVEGKMAINSLTQDELDSLGMSNEVARVEASESLCRQALVSLRLRRYLAGLFEKFAGIEHMISGIVANRDGLLSETKRNRLLAEMLIFSKALDYLDREIIGFFFLILMYLTE
jgi:FMN phosphatase YigB (HAD superfamily)/hydroxymethylpyrimidine pyrophosphatase-like HAD family hydrolase